MIDTISRQAAHEAEQIKNGMISSEAREKFMKRYGKNWFD